MCAFYNVVNLNNVEANLFVLTEHKLFDVDVDVDTVQVQRPLHNNTIRHMSTDPIVLSDQCRLATKLIAEEEEDMIIICIGLGWTK